MINSRKSWREKLADNKNLPKVFHTAKEGASQRWGVGMCLIAQPSDVDALMKRVPRGRLITINKLRSALAQSYKVDMACPLTTGIFAWIAAHPAAEGMAAGEAKSTPYWRTLKTSGETNPKYPGGVSAQKLLLKREGHRFERKGKRWLVAGFEEKLARLRVVSR